MAIDRSLYKNPFEKGSIPGWRCSSCGVGTLTLIKDTLHIEETAESRGAYGHEAWEPDWIEKRFICLMQCSHGTCKEPVAVAGRSRHVQAFDPVEGERWDPVFYPTYFCPPVAVFPLSTECPEGVANEVLKSFSSLWNDPGAAVNHLRIAMEDLLTWHGIKLFVTNKEGKKVKLQAHARINILTQKDPTMGQLLMAAKWIGNEGSHPGKVTIDDVLDTMDLFHHVLEELVDERTKKLISLAKGINKNKGPVKKKKRNLKK